MSNPTVELEVHLQYKGELASAIQTVKPAGRDARAPMLMGIFDSHLNVLTLNQVNPHSKEIVWGCGQIRARWVLQKGSDEHIQMCTFFHDAYRTIAENCPIATIGSIWFKETGKLTRHVYAKLKPPIPKQNRRARRLSLAANAAAADSAATDDNASDHVLGTGGGLPVTNAVIPPSVSALSASHMQPTDQESPVTSTNVAPVPTMTTRQLAARLSALNVHPTTVSAGVHGDDAASQVAKRKREDNPSVSEATPVAKRPNLTLNVPMSMAPADRPSPLTIPKFSIIAGRSALFDHPIQSRVNSPTRSEIPYEGYILPSMSFQQYRVDLSGVRATLVQCIQRQLGQTRGRLTEATMELTSAQTELAKERNWRVSLEEETVRLAARLEVAHVTLPPSPPHSPIPARSASPALGTKDRPLTLEDEIYALSSDIEEEAPSAQLDKGSAGQEFAAMATEMQQLREALAKEQAAREAAEQENLTLQRSLESERELRIQAEKRFDLVEGVAPAAVPGIMVALARIARLTDKVVAGDDIE